MGNNLRQVTDSTGTIWQSTDGGATWGTLSGTTVTALTKDTTVTLTVDPSGQNTQVTVNTYHALPDSRNQFIAEQRSDIQSSHSQPQVYTPQFP